MSENSLYVALVESRENADAFVQTYWARAADVGSAIERMIEAARRNGLKNPDAVEADPYEIENLKGEVEPSPEAEVFWSPQRFHYEPEPAFQLPTGVIASCIRDEGDEPGDIKEGYTVSTDERGLTGIEVNVERAELLPLYQSLLRQCGEYKVFWYLLHSHWDDREDAFLVNEAINTPEKIEAHIREHALDSLENGFVTLTAYAKEGATNINISDHKRIIIWTYSQSMLAAYERALQRLEFERATKLVSIDCRMYHWHYRRPGSRSRDELSKFLREIGFSDWRPGEKRNSKGDI